MADILINFKTLILEKVANRKHLICHSHVKFVIDANFV